MKRLTKLLLIDSDTRRRATVCHMLSEVGIHVEPFESATEIEQHWPRAGLVLVEDDDGSVPDLIARMTRDSNWLPVIAFSEHPTTHDVAHAIMEGAVDYLEWPFTVPEIREVINSAAHNAARIGTTKLREAQARSRLQALTQREREVLAGVADGLSNRMIGEKLAISPRTVEIHRANMLTKMGANHTSEAIRIAIEASLMH